jgi:ATP-dependent RNA helicase RhlE
MESSRSQSQSQRLAALRDFKSGAVRVLLATDIAARGIDVEGISHVVNFDFPPQPEDYVHRIGRTGRAKAIGDAISFVTPNAAANLRALERFINRGIPRKVAEGFDARSHRAAPILSHKPAYRPQRSAHPAPHSHARAGQPRAQFPQRDRPVRRRP